MTNLELTQYPEAVRTVRRERERLGLNALLLKSGSQNPAFRRESLRTLKDGIPRSTSVALEKKVGEKRVDIME